ncbi:hypothetical protein FHL15_000511 [Xylaria flabelliformis]|uniref:Uncharacterized protein n=1 Tax=Xylaria flabelliformis TaxID=2512241 RepID=A0A553IE06_9PEZI|nr:hypothetical protein FHL15_000511 [Xylaria flabelliformis]
MSMMSETTLPQRGALSTDQGYKLEPVWFWSSDSTAHVHGIGTVELVVKDRPGVSDKTPLRILRLVDVLHVPNLPVNVIAAQPEIGDWISPKINSYIYDNDKNLVAYFPFNQNRLLGEPGDSVKHLLETSEQSAMSLVEPCVRLDKHIGPVAAPSNYPVECRIALADFPSYYVDRQIISWKEVEQLRWRTYKCMRQESALPTHDPTTSNAEDARKPRKRMRITSNNGNGAPSNSAEAGASRTAQHAQNSHKKVKFNDNLAVKSPPYSSSEFEYLRENGLLKPGDAEHRNGGCSSAGATVPIELDEGDEECTFEVIQSQSDPDASRRNGKPSQVTDKEYAEYMRERYPNIDKFFEARQLDISKAGDWDKAHSIMRSCISSPVPAPSVSSVTDPLGTLWLSGLGTTDECCDSSTESENIGLVSQNWLLRTVWLVVAISPVLARVMSRSWRSEDDRAIPASRKALVRTVRILWVRAVGSTAVVPTVAAHEANGLVQIGEYGKSVDVDGIAAGLGPGMLGFDEPRCCEMSLASGALSYL